MPTPKQAYVWANNRTPQHTALEISGELFEAKACPAPEFGVWMFNEAGVLGFFDSATHAAAYCKTCPLSPLLGIVVAKPADTVTHWCNRKGQWFSLRYLGNVADKALAVAPATLATLATLVGEPE